MNIIKINGVTIDVPDGASVVIGDGEVRINGQAVEAGKIAGRIQLEITGKVRNLTVRNGNATVHGNVDGNVEASGSVSCYAVGGDVDAGGSVSVSGPVQGGVDAGGSVTCGDVGGDVDAGGSIRMGRKG